MIKKNLSRRDFIKKTSIFSLANLLVPPVTSMKKLSPKSGVSAVSNIKRKYVENGVKQYARLLRYVKILI